MSELDVEPLDRNADPVASSRIIGTNLVERRCWCGFPLISKNET
jgi:hypothetical protein